MEYDFQKVCKLSGLKEKEGRRFIVNEVDVAVFLVEGKVYALSNICPHQHAALMYDGFIEDGCVVCPAHGWEFNLETGIIPGGQRGINSYEVKIIDDDIYVKVFTKELNW
ncbi:MAG: nitrite reductase (NAD(P)H) small subunit [Bacteroidetes bacterium]|nr:nitrite reductase (NAD(P)H) small subunit [Bacteroidota bacterium]